MSLLLETADIDWSHGVPFNKQFGDFYFQSEGGHEESQYVFIEANELDHRFRKPHSESDSLVIVETGFGTGLNFIATLHYWKTLPEPKKRLDFVSIECFPLTQQDLSRAALVWPELAHSYKALLEQYPPAIRGCHSLYFEDGKVTLRLIFDTLENTIAQYSLPADVWYLDGFSPSTNNAMWTEDAFAFLASNSKTSTTLSTFTAAGFIQRALKAHGFNIKKRTGYGPKREMITARFQGFQTQSEAELVNNAQHPCYSNNHSKQRVSFQPWHLPEPRICKAPKDNEARIPTSDAETTHPVAVVGAGIAGLTTALTLASKGFRVVVIEKSAKPLAGASSQPQLIMYGKYPKKPNNESALLLHSQLFAERFFDFHQSRSSVKFWHPIGVVQLSWNEHEQSKHKSFLENFQLPEEFARQLSREEIQNLSGIPCSNGGIYFERSGWLDTKAFAHYVLSHGNIEWRPNCTLTSIEHKDKGVRLKWKKDLKPGVLDADHVVLCNAYDAQTLLPETSLPLKKLRGQTTQLKSFSPPPPKTVLCGEGYLCPSSDQEVHLGATYDLIRNNANIIAEDNLENINQLSKWLPLWSSAQELMRCISGSEAGARTTTSDYTPIVGQSIDDAEFKKKLSGLKQNAKGEKETFGIFEDGIHVNIGYGSKGLTFSPACADLLASNIANVPNGHSHLLQKMLSPARFVVRALKKSS